MEMRKIPHSDLTVSKICLGSMNWGQQNTEEEAHEQLDYATTHGINFIDTAEIYPIPPGREKQGLTETYIGTWLKKRGRRDDVVIASKVAGRIQAGSMATRDSSMGLTRDAIQTAIEGTLVRLQTDFVDLYQVHVPDRSSNYFGIRGYEAPMEEAGASIEETLEALAELVKDGKVRHIGVSNETPWGVHEYLTIAEKRGFPRIVTIQNQYSLLNRTFEIGLSELCLKEQVGLLPYSPLSKGTLTGKYVDGARPPGARFSVSERDVGRYNPEDVQIPL